jgi:gluconate 2-dehydrogenase gamma chain
MNRSQTLRRRKFLQIAAVAGASGAAVSCGGPTSSWRFFTDSEAQTLAAICEQIIPADQDPGAREAGIVNFIDRQLEQFLRPLQKAYREGLAAFEQVCARKTGKRFTELSPAAQTEFLAKLDKSLKPFFDTVVGHTMQGFYGDPRHGGNRDAASWKMLGVPLMPTRGRAHYDLTKKSV